MVHRILLFLVLIISFPGFSQDFIRRMNGESFYTTVIRIDKDSVLLDHGETGDSLRLMAKSEIAYIYFSNRVKMVFHEIPAEVSDITEYGDSYSTGVADANRYYTNYKAAGTTTLITSAMFPLMGLIPAIACSSTPPSPSNLGMPPLKTTPDPSYTQGYKEAAKKIKSKKVWKNYGIGAGIGASIRVAYIIGVIVLISSISKG